MKSVNIPQLGEVLIVKKKNSRRIKITVKPFEGVKLTLPYYISYSTGIDFLESKKDWALASLNRMRKLEQRQNNFFERGYIQTITGKIYISVNNDNRNLKLDNGDTIIWLNNADNLDNFTLRDNAIEKITEELRLRAKEYLIPRTKYLAEKYRFEYKLVRVKNVKTLWGSCSSKNNINLNLHLIRLSSELIDYIILHELTHTKVKNHSKLFWNKLLEICPNALEYRKRLRTFHVDTF